MKNGGKGWPGAFGNFGESQSSWLQLLKRAEIN